MASITVEKLHCNEPSEHGHDEVYMKVTVDGSLTTQYPLDGGYESMTSGDDWSINQTYAYNTNCTICFYDSDAGGDDNLGCFTVQTSGSNPSSPVTLTGSGGSYLCYFSISG